MFQKIILLLITLLMLFLTSCGGDTQNYTSQGTESFVSMMNAEVSPMTSSASNSVTAEMTMDWAESKFPELFPKENGEHHPQIEYDGAIYNARAYTGNWEGVRYLGITQDGRVYGLGDFTENILHQFETIDYWADQVLADLNNTSPVLATISIPDPVEYYSHACEAPSIQFVIPVEINDDNTNDFIIHYWCDAPWDDFGETFTTPTPDALVVQLSQPDGTYRVGNEEIFGNSFYGLGGASRKYVRGDINGDGKDDFAFAMNWEDGRSGADPTTNATEPSILMSTPSGGYEVVRVGEPDWGHAVGIVNNVDGTVEVFFAGFTHGFQAFRYENGQFIDVTNTYPQNAREWATGVQVINKNGVTEYIVASDSVNSSTAEGYSVSKVGLSLYKRSENSWIKLDEFMFDADFNVDFISWSHDLGTTSVYTINGEQYAQAAFDSFQIMEGGLSGSDDDLIVGKIAASIDRYRDYVEGAEDPYKENEAAPVNIYQFFEFSDAGVTLVESPIINEEANTTYNFFDAKDINGDGYLDLATYAFSLPYLNNRVEEGGKPIIYLNDGFGKLINTNIDHLPGKDGYNLYLQSLVNDVNNDGIVDYLIFGTTSKDDGGIIDIHLLREPIQ